MRIVAFSDYVSQDIRKTVEFAASMNPDVILYAGGGMGRFGPLDGNAMARLLVRNRSRQIGIRRCESLGHDGRSMTPDGEDGRQNVHPPLRDTYYFNLDVSGTTKPDVINEISRVLREDGAGYQKSEIFNMRLCADFEGVSVESLLGKASVHLGQAQDGAEGIISLRPDNHVRGLASASRCGFGAVLGDDDDHIYKSLLTGDGAFDLHDRPIDIGRFAIIGQESPSFVVGWEHEYLVHSEDEIESHLNAPLQSKKDHRRIILVSHTPPHRILDRYGWSEQDHTGSPAVREFIAKHKPLLVFCGRVRAHGGCETKIGPTTIINLASDQSRDSPGRVCVVDVSDDLRITTRWFLVLPDRVAILTARQLEEGDALNSTRNIPNVGHELARNLELVDIRTVKDVCEAGAERLVQCDISRDHARRLIKRARSVLDQQMRPPSPLVIPHDQLMFVDTEMDLKKSYVWMISTLVEGRRDSLSLFYAKTPADEKDILRDFLSFYDGFDGCVLCHYGESDESVIRHRIATHGLDGSRLGRWFDLQQAIRESRVLGFGSSLRLKKIAYRLGYPFRHPNMNGYEAALMYECTISKRDEITTNTLLEYAADDVLSMDHIISNMDRVAGTIIDRS